MEQAQHTVSIIYQDHHLLIVNKPAGLVVHPTYKHTDGTLWDMLLAFLDQQESDGWSPLDLPDEPGWEHAPEPIRQMVRERRLAQIWQEEGWLPRPVLLHRLDKDTSGVVALARTARACRHVAIQFHTHTIVKTYLAVVQHASPTWAQPRSLFTATLYRTDGAIEQLSWPLDFAAYHDAEILLDGPLQRDPDDRRRCIVGPDGQSARTHIRVLAVADDLILIEARPITGRTHQIRAHLAATGYALVGDSTYSPIAEPGTPAAALTRQFLHAHSLTLRDYPANQSRTFVAPLPHDLTAWLELYFSGALGSIDERTTEPTVPSEHRSARQAR